MQAAEPVPAAANLCIAHSGEKQISICLSYTMLSATDSQACIVWISFCSSEDPPSTI